MPNCQWAKRHCFMSCLSNAEEPKIHASKQHRSDSHTAPGRRGSFGGICGGLGRRKEMAEMPLADLRDRPFRAPLLHLLWKRRHGSEIQRCQCNHKQVAIHHVTPGKPVVLTVSRGVKLLSRSRWCSCTYPGPARHSFKIIQRLKGFFMIWFWIISMLLWPVCNCILGEHTRIGCHQNF